MFGDKSNWLKRHFEDEVTTIHSGAILAALKRGHSVLVDDTNLNKKFLESLKGLMQGFCNETGKSVGFETVIVNTDVKECIRRDKARGDAGGRTVGEAVIKKLHQRMVGGVSAGWIKDGFEALIPTQFEDQDRSLDRVILCDLDGTLCDISHRNPYDASNCENDGLVESVYNVINAFYDKNYKIFLFSGRSDIYKPETLEFLEKHSVGYDKLVMRREGDTRKDSVVKEEFYNDHVKDKFYVEFILDDRDQVVAQWRKMGLKVFQVSYGDF